MIEVKNLTFTPVDEIFLKKAAENVLKGERKKKFYLSIALIGRSRMKELNKKYLKRNYATDVLAFPETEKHPKINILGEIIICPQVIKNNAKKFNFVFKKELCKVLIHGILHLLGYGHKKSAKEAEKMERKENYYLKKMF
ncbi:MAG: rRNA maturation RNase YbeY [Candidatus Nealsonbacteria bacterium]